MRLVQKFCPTRGGTASWFSSRYIRNDRFNCARLFTQEIFVACCLDLETAGSNMAARMAMMPMTTNSSMSVKAARVCLPDIIRFIPVPVSCINTFLCFCSVAVKSIVMTVSGIYGTQNCFQRLPQGSGHGVGVCRPARPVCVLWNQLFPHPAHAHRTFRASGRPVRYARRPRCQTPDGLCNQHRVRPRISAYVH